jgi:hypothetical protein
MLLEFDSMKDYRDAVFDDLYDSIPSLVGWEILEVYSDEEMDE